MPAIARRTRGLLLERDKPAGDPMPVPTVDCRSIEAERCAQIVENAQIVERMNIAGDCKRKRSYPCARQRRARQERRLRVRLLEILDDSERLGECAAVILENRHEALRIQRQKFRPALLAAAAGKMPR